MLVSLQQRGTEGADTDGRGHLYLVSTSCEDPATLEAVINVKDDEKQPELFI